MTNVVQPFGHLLREWRERRRLSQLDLAVEAEISQRHLSFVESGRSVPSRDMVLHLAEQLDVPLRERNVLLTAAGYAPVFQARSLSDEALRAARDAIDLLLAGHSPYPALAIDRHWQLVAANKAVSLLIEGADAPLLQSPINVLRLSLHPAGLASRIVNYREWRTHVLARLSRQIDLSADLELIKLRNELKDYPPPADAASPPQLQHDPGGVTVPFRLRVGDALLSFLSTTTVFGTPVDITISELAIESFFPADSATAEAMRRLDGTAGA